MADVARLIVDADQDDADVRRTERFWCLYERLFGLRPDGWQVLWHIQGMTLVEAKTVFFPFNGVMDNFDLGTVIHEMMHIADPERPHGKEFERECRRLVRLATQRPKKATRGAKSTTLAFSTRTTR